MINNWRKYIGINLVEFLIITLLCTACGFTRVGNPQEEPQKGETKVKPDPVVDPKIDPNIDPTGEDSFLAQLAITNRDVAKNYQYKNLYLPHPFISEMVLGKEKIFSTVIRRCKYNPPSKSEYDQEIESRRKIGTKGQEEWIKKVQEEYLSVLEEAKQVHDRCLKLHREMINKWIENREQFAQNCYLKKSPDLETIDQNKFNYSSFQVISRRLAEIDHEIEELKETKNSVSEENRNDPDYLSLDKYIEEKQMEAKALNEQLDRTKMNLNSFYQPSLSKMQQKSGSPECLNSASNLKIPFGVFGEKK